MSNTEDSERELELLADEPNEFWVCMPCLAFPPEDRVGAIHVPNGTKGRVWCPWCGDAMNPDIEEILTPAELDQVRALKPANQEEPQ